MRPTPAFKVGLGGARSYFENAFGVWLRSRKLPSGVSVTQSVLEKNIRVFIAC